MFSKWLEFITLFPLWFDLKDTNKTLKIFLKFLWFENSFQIYVWMRSAESVSEHLTCSRGLSCPVWCIVIIWLWVSVEQGLPQSLEHPEHPAQPLAHSSVNVHWNYLTVGLWGLGVPITVTGASWAPSTVSGTHLSKYPLKLTGISVSCPSLKKSNLNSNRCLPIKSFPTLSVPRGRVGLLYFEFDLVYLEHWHCLCAVPPPSLGTSPLPCHMVYQRIWHVGSDVWNMSIWSWNISANFSKPK